MVPTAPTSSDPVANPDYTPSAIGASMLPVVTAPLRIFHAGLCVWRSMATSAVTLAPPSFFISSIYWMVCVAYGSITGSVASMCVIRCTSGDAVSGAAAIGTLGRFTITGVWVGWM